jgi:hypothetical protein
VFVFFEKNHQFQNKQVMAATRASEQQGFEGTGLDHGKPPPAINVEVYGFGLWAFSIVAFGATIHV